MDEANAIELIDAIPWDENLEAEWQRQIRGIGTASPTIARNPLNSPSEPRGRELWLLLRRPIFMLIAILDKWYGIETKKR